jgi:hexosaminidase
MAMNKMNVFHWHITDSHTWPIQISKRPELSKLGAYSSREIYTADHVKEIVEYGQARGVRVCVMSLI